MTAIFGLTKLKQRAQGTKNVSQTVSTRSWTLAENVFSPDDSFIGNNWKKHKKIARKILMIQNLIYQNDNSVHPPHHPCLTFPP